MADAVEVPTDIADRLRTICLALPQAYEERAWLGFRWRIRNRNFAHVWSVDRPEGMLTAVWFWSLPPERDALVRSGRPFFQPRHGKYVVGMVLNHRTDWTEVTEVLTDSYCVHAPKKLAAQVAPPS